MYANSGPQLVSKERLDREALERKQLRASGNTEDPRVKWHKVTDAIDSMTDFKAKSMLVNFLRKAVNSTDIQGRRMTSYFEQMYELANTDTISLNLLLANGIAETTDLEYGWRETSPNGSVAPVFFNLNHTLPTEAESTEAIRTGTCGAYGNVILVPWITQSLGEQSKLGAYDVLSEQIKNQMRRMQRFRNQKFMVNDEVTSEIIGDTPQWKGFYTDSELNASAAGGSPTDLTNTLINALHVDIADPTSLDALGLHVDLTVLTTPAQLRVVKGLEIAKYTNAESSTTYLNNQARLNAKFPGVKLDPDQVVFYQTDLGAVMAFIHDPLFSALASGVTFAFDHRRPRIVKFRLMDSLGPYAVKREIPELVDEYVFFDVEGIATPNQETRGSLTNCN